ncbi:glycoside hydrolase family 3 protein [Candidatus Woesearchaeota archaeon]|nr:glycoside hydrolase family 3 protein [Candidatus Woesearchaeota archaeon]
MMTKRKKQRDLQQTLFIILITMVLFLGTLNIVKGLGFFIPSQPSLLVVNNTINLEEMTLEQKIAQMVIVHGGLYNLQTWKKLQLGGVHLFAMQREELFRKTINEFQKEMMIPFFVSADFEGCLNPFSAFRPSIPVREITSVGDAFEKGKSEGSYLHTLGFSVNFAPVVDLNDQIWKCRSFPGNATTIGKLAEAYTLGLQREGIIATAKHYPGKTLVIRDPHKEVVAAVIEKSDLLPYEKLNKVVKGVMVSHLIVEGAIDSEGKPSVAAREIVGELKEKYPGLIFTDEIQMLGLRNFYPSLDEVYINVFKAGNDMILNFGEDPEEMHRMIQVVAEAVRRGEISKKQIDASVRKILMAKGFRVK